MTVNEFKQELPLVMVRKNDKIYTGRPGGRKNKFCSVALWHDGKKYIMGEIVQFSWESVTRAYNENAILRAD